MSDPILLLYKSRPTQIANLQLDGTLTETHTRTSDVTEFEVEAGADITDHVRVKPATVAIEGIVTNTPLDRSQVADYKNAGPFLFNQLPDTSLDDSPQVTPGRAENAFALLEALWLARAPITVLTNLKTYESMVISSLVVPRDAKTGDAVHFTMSLTQVRLVSNKLTTVQTATPGGKRKQKLGDKQGVEKPKEEYQSQLTRMTGVGEVGEGLN
jgi:hypothetical protein